MLKLSVTQLIVIAVAMGLVGIIIGAQVERGLDGLDTKRRAWTTAGIVLGLAALACTSLASDLGWLGS